MIVKDVNSIRPCHAASCDSSDDFYILLNESFVVSSPATTNSSNACRLDCATDIVECALTVALREMLDRVSYAHLNGHGFSNRSTVEDELVIIPVGAPDNGIVGNYPRLVNSIIPG